MDTDSLRSFSLANNNCNIIANRALWRSFRITGESQAVALLQCEAILRNPRRAFHIRRLEVGPFFQPYGSGFLDKVQHVWAALPNLRDLSLESRLVEVGFRFHRGVQTSISPVPLLRNLTMYGQTLQLEAFKCTAWLRPDSSLYEFLHAHPTIRTLIGVDIFATRVPSIPDGFLPNLETLKCNRQVTAELFVYRRSVTSLHISQAAKLPARLEYLGDMILASSTLVKLDICVFDSPTIDEHVEEFLKSLCNIKVLFVSGYRFVDRTDIDITLPSLEHLKCSTGIERQSPDIAELALRIGSNIRRMDLWVWKGSSRSPSPSAWSKTSIIE